MKANNEDQKKRIIAGVLGFFAILAVAYLYQTLFGGTTTVVPAAVVTSGAVITTRSVTNTGTSAPGFGVHQAVKVGTGGTQLDPTLHEEAMLVTEGLVYTGSGRNIFVGASEAPVQIAKVVQPIAPARPISQPPPQVAQGPPPIPPPPPINLKFFGTTTATNGDRRAFLLNGDDVFVASMGDVVERRYRVVSISANSILVEDIPNSNRQTLPLMAN